MNEQERLGRLAQHVAAMVEDGMRIGLGSGSTAEAFIEALGKRVAAGLRVQGVPTSERTIQKATEAGLELTSLAEHAVLDLGVDGADEIDPHLNLVKGKGGALLYEKIVASACQTWIIVASSQKLVDQLGTRIRLPVELIPFGWQQTARLIREIGLEPELRSTASGETFITDGGHVVVDCQTGPIEDAAALGLRLKSIPGVVEHGLFIGLADQVVTVDPEGAIAVRRRSDLAPQPRSTS